MQQPRVKSESDELDFKSPSIFEHILQHYVPYATLLRKTTLGLIHFSSHFYFVYTRSVSTVYYKIEVVLVAILLESRKQL